MPTYRVSGLTVTSELPLPGAMETAVGARPDVTIRRGSVPERLERPSASGPTWQLAGPRLLLEAPGVCRFLLSDGRDVACSLDGAASLDEAGMFALTPVLGLLLHQRRRIVLHASAVLVGGRAVLFCGPPGVGKSTLAAALVRRGCPLVADDMCALSFEASGPPQVWPEGSTLKLWADAIDQLGFEAKTPVRAGLHKFHVDAAAAPPGAVPLGAIYVLRETRPPAAGIERPGAMEAVLLVRRSAYRARMLEAMDQKAAYFNAAARLGDTAGLFRLGRPFGFARMDEVIAGLYAHWAQAGLVEPAA